MKSLAARMPSLPSMPPGLDLQQLWGQNHWHQRWEVFPGVFTPGHNPVDFLCQAIGLPGDLRGQRVLDVGAWHGCFSFECERRGAEEVVALSLEDPETNGFQRLHRALNSRVRYVQQSVYSLDPKELGEFDLVLFLGVLYHLRYPLLAIDRLRTVCRGKVLIESHVIDNYFEIETWRGKKIVPLNKIHRHLSAVPLWRFYPGPELNNDPSNWFGPNIKAVQEAFTSAGFQVTVLERWGDRATFTAQPQADLRQSLKGSYEAWQAGLLFPANPSSPP
jgi:tRNA (mo5U34)-methyltransferase